MFGKVDGIDEDCYGSYYSTTVPDVKPCEIPHDEFLLRPESDF